MRTSLIILILATFVSCGKKTNEINIPNTQSTFISEKALVVPHDENGSVIRPKLLNKIVENSFPALSANQNSIIQIHDELHKVELSEGELKDYEIKEKILTKVVVSFSDREEVYFIKERIPVQDFILTLRLNPEQDRKLKMVPTPYTQSFPGAVFYIASVSYEDLMKNDQQFYSAESAIDNFQEKIYFQSYKSVLLKVDYDFKAQSLAPAVYTAPKVRCSRDSIEDGSCGNGCSFTANLPINKFEKATPENLQDLGLVVKYDDNLVKVDSLSVINAKEGYFEMKLNAAEIVDGQRSFQVSQIPSALYTKAGARYNFSSGCSSEDRAKVSPYNQATQVSMNVKVNIFGRGEELKKIKL